MTVEYHINQRDELITLTATGAVTSAEASKCLDDLLNDAAFDAALPQLIDLRTAEPSGRAVDMAAFEAFLLGDYGPNLSALVAIVVNPAWDEVQCAKAFWISCALGSAEIFDGWSQACRWLIKRDFGGPSTSETRIDASSGSPGAGTLSDLAGISAISPTTVEEPAADNRADAYSETAISQSDAAPNSDSVTSPG